MSFRSEFSKRTDYNDNISMHKNNIIENRNCDESVRVNLGDRRSSVNSISPKIENEAMNILNKIEDFDFNIFDLNKIVGIHSMIYVAHEIFQSLYFYEHVINQKIYRNFVMKISEGYNREGVSYHNDLHATDVLQPVFVLMEKGNVYYKCQLMEMDYIAILVAAICHDYKHPGIGNSYLVNSKHYIAMSFNGKIIFISFYYFLLYFIILFKQIFT